MLVTRKQHADRMSDAFSKLFLIVFLLYPGLTAKIFEGLTCRDLGGVSVLDVDYSVNCEKTVAVRWLGCGALVLIWPVGLPVVLFWSMYKKKDRIVAGDEETLQTFDFVLGDYVPERWYWECVELSRKLVLSGLIGLVGRGTIAQCFTATLISFFYFAIAVKSMPYKSDKLNRIKIFSEFQLFGVLLVCVILQTNRTGLPITGLATANNYGVFQLMLTITIIPIVIYMIAYNAKELRDQAREDKRKKANAAAEREFGAEVEGGAGEEFGNPLSIEDADRDDSSGEKDSPA